MSHIAKMEQILDKLFESTTKVRLLKLFLMNPDGQFTMPEVVKQTQLKRQAVKKELAKLMRLGLVKTKILTIPELRVKKLKKILNPQPKNQVVKNKKTAAKENGRKNENSHKSPGRKNGKEKVKSKKKK
ncbi:MAG: hypothetical protein A3G49_05455 [Candidatus Sungbacteria bacterium RIFCSPLOWO2_12_FULL_41_11]|uniref:Uncharacterized protein n=1 Tax=Candidatus Sungbacteria bacterium RIFCSPLOWO2_12_FULL_41_11 TaxID=1802286 RepID=A0A1G2LUN8_9BACT|nr:MAG: hypothetical protein UV01_C0008G0058 [Parcubacteria group bacterium GW2011_GWA2_42_14]OGZ98380.1 MAG: hypothetical protein A3D41_00080 [Candidatus Sungbacteria bacterium RIFCSPHIGHO2_02_FULL_41_12b]OHA14609.1 MAG: hypothetical protein A3G49_05455 [Candidatus Sungbacteria bacterium RIFCSPLOWO2_12_FULL_41_11]